MKHRDHRPLAAAAPEAPRPSSEPTSHQFGPVDHFLRLMFFHPSEEIGPSLGHRRRQLEAGPYTPLRQSTAKSTGYSLPQRTTAPRVRLESPAIDAMTDLRRVGAITIGGSAAVNEANEAMMIHGVRALFVVGDARRMLGIVTSTDLLGEKPIQLTQQRGIRREEVLVGDIMTPADQLEAMALDDVQYARVGDVVATLRLSGRQHALVVDTAEQGIGGDQIVCGIFSLTQIARQLGLPAQPLHNIARTFAEIEAAIAS